MGNVFGVIDEADRRLLAACAFGVVTLAYSQAALPRIVQDAIDKSRQECHPEQFTQLKAFLRRQDINGDGRIDFILDYGEARCGDATTYYCGTGGCLTQVFASRDDGTYVQVLDENVRRLRFARVKGRPAMLLDLHGSACGRAGAAPCAATLFWNGSAFSPAN
jgi:hypothetical protein